MTVICKINKCPFCSSSGFCKNDLVSITGNGQCGWIFDSHGVVRIGWQKKPVYQEKEKKEIAAVGTNDEWMGYTE